MSGTHTAGPTWQQYEDYYNQLQSTPTAYSVPVQQAAQTQVQAPPTPTFGDMSVQDLANVLATLNLHFARGGITDALPYNKHRG